MKILSVSVVSLLLGLLAGWYIGHRYSEREKSEIVQQMVQGTQSSDRERAARAVGAIQLIESGEAQKAVELLSTPVAHYYSLYADSSKSDESTKLCALIDQLAKTNHAVAARIAEAATTRINTP